MNSTSKIDGASAFFQNHLPVGTDWLGGTCIEILKPKHDEALAPQLGIVYRKRLSVLKWDGSPKQWS